MPFTFASHALVTSEAVSKFIDGSDDWSASLTSQEKYSVELLVNAISKQIMKHVSSDIKAADYTEVWDGAGSDELVPRERPIISVTSVKFASDGDFDSQSAIDGDGVTADSYSIRLRWGRTPVGRGLVQVVYRAGFEEVPDDIVLATLLQLQWGLRKMKRGDAFVGMQSASKNGETQVKDRAITTYGLIAEVVGLLDPYRRFEAPLSIMFSRVS